MRHCNGLKSRGLVPPIKVNNNDTPIRYCNRYGNLKHLPFIFTKKFISIPKFVLKLKILLSSFFIRVYKKADNQNTQGPTH